MKISDIIVESIDQQEADEVLKSLFASGDPVAKYFQQTRYNPVHSSIDSAQRAAERMYHADRRRQELRKTSTTVKKDTTKFQPIDKSDLSNKKERDPADWGDRFYGNQYTGSLGRSASLGDVDLGIDFDQTGLKTVGKAIGAVKSVTKPFSNIMTAFKSGMNKAPNRR